MLVLSRKERERIIIRQAGQPDIVIEVVLIDCNKTRLGITAPKEVGIFREELLSQAPSTEAHP